MRRLPVWVQLWLVFAVIWLVLTALEIFTLFAFGEGDVGDQVLRALVLGFAVPAGIFMLGWLWSRWRKGK